MENSRKTLKMQELEEKTNEFTAMVHEIQEKNKEIVVLKEIQSKKWEKENLHLKLKDKSEEIEVKSRDLHERAKENKVLKEVVKFFSIFNFFWII